MKKAICLVLSVVFLFGVCACKGANVTSSTQSALSPDKLKYDEIGTVSESMNLGDFDESFIGFIDSNTEGNYMVSPLSFRYALGLLLAGAEGETKTQLLGALGVKDEAQWTEYAVKFNGFVKQFYDEINGEAQMYKNWSDDTESGKVDLKPKRALRVANSVWKRQDIKKDFKAAYKEYISKNYGAEYNSFTRDNAVAKINAWVNEKTEKLIPRLLPDDYDAENLAVVLMNALYFKDNWQEPFDEYSTKDGDFNAKSGKITKKKFMEKTDRFSFYSDADTRLLILPMTNGVYMTFVLGDTAGLGEKISKAQTRKVHVKIPKMDIETSFDKGEFINFLASRGVKDAFDRNRADFSKMIDHKIWVDDIIQKTKIKTDEEGVEAAAVTAVMMKDAAMIPDDEKPVEFIADRPFSFYIYPTCDDITALMFNGKMVE